MNNNTNEYKETEIGEIPEEWEVVTIGDVTLINHETKNPDKENPGAYFVYLDISGVESETGRIIETKRILGKDAPSRARRIVHTNDVILSTVRPYLKAFTLVPPELDGQVCSTGYAVLTPTDKIAPQYLLYVAYTDAVTNQFKQYMRGANYPAINPGHIKTTKIPLPPLSEQHRIAYTLRTVQEAREKTEAVITASRELKKSMMKHLFTYGSTPPNQTHKIKLKQTEIGEIPEEWGIKNIGGVFELSQGLQIEKSLRKQAPEKGYIPILKITDLPERRYSEYVTNIKETFIATKEDIIYTRTGRVGLVYTDVEGCVHNNCFKIHYDKDKFNKYFVYYSLSQDRVFSYSNTVAGGSSQKDLTHPAFKSCLIVIPPLPEQNVIANMLQKVDNKIQTEINMQKALDDLFNTLLNNLMTAKLRVNHLEVLT